MNKEMNYSNKKWRNKRAYILKRDRYKCRECMRFGRTSNADTVHHIYEAEKHVELRHTNWNLVSLCNTCHNKMHDRDNQTLTEQGLQWQRLLRRQYKRSLLLK